jgi:catechol 2,3-dioxygenase-like lactoylglutathione lyase family enzyme
MAMGADGVATEAQAYVVGGVRLPRPFRIRRLGHFGFNVDEVEPCLDFYRRLLGFRVSDPIDFGARLPAGERGRHGPGTGYFLRHGTDHHSFVLFPGRVLRALRGNEFPEVTTNQITWQVGSLREVVDGHAWMRERGVRINRAGRDTPGSNWHFYPFDPDGHINELYYGIEQIGWNGLSKPAAMHRIGHREAPALPQRSEWAEVLDHAAQGVDLFAGTRQAESGEERYDVGGVLLARPFKIVRIGPVRLFVRDLESALAFYRDRLGLAVTEEVLWRGHRCVFLRVNTEHHSLALYPLALRGELDLNPGTTCLSFGLQLGDYRQLRDALAFLREHGVTVRHLPAALSSGIDYSAFAIDPAGHALQLYYYMEQVGWDGRPRPRDLPGETEDEAAWPDTVEARSDTFAGEPFLGPWG